MEARLAARMAGLDARIEATYRLHGDEAAMAERIRAVAVELTVEVPEALIARFPEIERTRPRRPRALPAPKPSLPRRILNFLFR